MTSKHYARGIGCALAIAGALGIVGCGGVASDETQIGESSQALQTPTTKAALNTLDMDTGTAGIQPPDGRVHAGVCVIKDRVNNADVLKILVGGGYKITAGGGIGAATDEILAFNPAGNTWEKLPVVLQTARGNLKAIQAPGDDTRCIFVGGSTSPTAAALKKVDEIDANGAGAFLRTSRTDLNIARANHVLTECGGKIYAIGGRDGTTALSSIEISSNNVAAAAWTTLGVGLNNAAWDVAFEKKPTQNRFLVAGGNSGSGQLSSIELIDATATACATPTVSLQLSTLNDAVEGAVAYFEGSADTFHVAAGLSASSGLATGNLDEIAVTNWASTSGVTVTAQTAIAAAYLPLVSRVSSSPFIHEIVGGSNGNFSTGTSHSTSTFNLVQEYTDGSGFASSSSIVQRWGGVIATVGGNAYVMTGASVAAGILTGVNTVEQISP